LTDTLPYNIMFNLFGMMQNLIRRRLLTMKTVTQILAILGFVFLSTGPLNAALLYYDGQDNDSTFINTTNNENGLTYVYANGSDVMQVSGGRRTVNGSGDPNGNDIIDLNPVTGSSWDQAALYDSVSGKIGGGNVEGIMYLSFLVKAHVEATAESERKTGDLPYGRYFGLNLFRDTTEVQGFGNGWDPIAYSIYGTASGDLIDGTGTNYTSWIAVNTSQHLMVARIAFHANAADDITVWLDPDPQDGNTQSNEVRRYIGTAKGDMSFNRIRYSAGNIPTLNAADFDEVRFGTSWEDVTPALQLNQAIWYDGQESNSSFINTTYDAAGMTYTMANGQPLPVTGGKRITPGTGDAGTDTFTLETGEESIWREIGLYDHDSGLIGGGDISGVLFFGALVRSQNSVSSTTEQHNGTPPEGTEAYMQLTRPGLNNLGAFGMGNAWSAWAYSIAGVFGGGGDFVQEGTSNYAAYNTSVHMMIAKIVFKANATDTVTAWLDPNPDNGDAQLSTIRRVTRSGDLSFSQISYRSGNLGALSSWEFDEVRFATSWQGIVTNMPPIVYPTGTLLMMH